MALVQVILQNARELREQFAAQRTPGREGGVQKRYKIHAKKYILCEKANKQKQLAMTPSVTFRYEYY